MYFHKGLRSGGGRGWMCSPLSHAATGTPPQATDTHNTFLRIKALISCFWGPRAQGD